MPVVNVNYNDLISLIGKDIEKDELIEKIPMIGVSLERFENGEISVEVFPNRPDLLGVEGIARAMKSFLEIESGLKKYDVSPPKIFMNVDKSVEKVRPYIGGAVVRNVEMNEETIISLMEMQEKLHFSVGKNRKKMAIGVHDFDKVNPPFLYKAVKPYEIKFVPLGWEEEMTMEEILEKHEKGIEYAYLLKNKDVYPIIQDKNENVLSFPPIINGQLTALSYETRNIFIDVTGTDMNAVLSALNIISTALAERGGKLEQVRIIGKEEIITPDLTPQKNELQIDYVKKILEIKNKSNIIVALKKMGHDVEEDGNKINVYSPAWRADILHPIDLVEDVAIGYGYERFKESMPKSVTFGKSFSFSKIQNTMIGLGFNEVVTLSLSNPEKEFLKMGIKGNAVQIENPISTEHSILKQSLLPSLLEILSKNRHNELPQQIYETGDVVLFEEGKAKQKTMLSGVKISSKANFTECKSIVEAILKNFGFKLEVEEKEHNSFINGRCASIIIDGEEAGYFGEIHPSVICNFELEYPVIAFEIDVSKLLPSLYK
ncbi:MAG TPA: phenylalanine--tRNA ligase subunit beta [Thermoplasmatales archaeon]|nr:phenylalanine--tRNA ligase subunit beta [Thermoplasmatales archaeon]